MKSKRERLHEAFPDRPTASKVFAQRLREMRIDRGKSQAQLAREMTEAGRPMNKLAVLRVEGEDPTRRLSLDEAIALSATLNAVPAHMLSPAEDEMVWLTDDQAVDEEGMWNWLRFGEALGFSEPARRERSRNRLELVVLAHAQALIDAHRGNDKAGMRVARDALIRTALQYEEITRNRKEADRAS